MPNSNSKKETSGKIANPIAKKTKPIEAESKKLGIGDLKHLVGAKTVASFARFISPDVKTLTVHEVIGLSGNRVVASFARFREVEGKITVANKDVEVFKSVNTVKDFDELEKKLTDNARFQE